MRFFDELACNVGYRLGRRQHVLACSIDPLADFAQLQFPSGAYEKPYAELRFQPGDLAAYG
ncbi:hypothetical protein WS52_30505 [Burkholderia territorii]|nr:hypothetical protein WS52_30505 [Burkholderia territorii]